MGCGCGTYGGRGVEKSWKKRQLGRTKSRWDYILKMDDKEVSLGGMDWIDVPQNRGR